MKQRKRRVNGEGTWGEKNINGLHYYFFRNSEGKYFYGKTQKEVDEKRQLKEKKIIKVTNKMTFGEYVKKWLYERKYEEVGITIQSTTFDTYEDALNRRFFKDNISNCQLGSLNNRQINAYLKSLAEKYSRASIHKTWVILKMALQDTDADGHELIPELNYAKIFVPTESNVAKKKKKVNYTTKEDMDKLYIEAFRKTSRDTFYYSDASKLLVFIMYSGLRLSEGCGLKWKNVDLENEIISIKQQTTKIRIRNEDGESIGYKVVDKDVKTVASVRDIPYLKRAGEVLQLMYNKGQHRPDDYVFTTSNGRPYTRKTVEKTLNRMLNCANCSTMDYTIHSLRHGYGSVLYENGVDLKTISELLGHNDISTTANIYVGVSANTLKDAINKVNKIIEEPPEE